MRLHPQLLRSIPALVGVALAGLVLILNSGGGKAAEENVAAVVMVTPNPTPSPPPPPFLYFYPSAFFQDESAAAVVGITRGGYPYGVEIGGFFSTSDGTAVGGESCGPGIDYIRVVNAYVRLQQGQDYTTVNVPLCADGISEPPETINLTVGGRTGVLTISDEPLRFSISGRVRTAGGRGIWNAGVVLVSVSQPNRYTHTRGSFGWYTFDNVVPGQWYEIAVTGAPRHTFTHTQLFVDPLVGDVTDADFTADP